MFPVPVNVSNISGPSFLPVEFQVCSERSRMDKKAALLKHSLAASRAAA